MKNKTPESRVLIVGCGELGSRHLQAIVALPGIRDIDIVEPNEAAQQLARNRIEEVKDRQSPAIRWLCSMDQATREGDLCIVATKADVRCKLVREAAEKLQYRSFLIEKIVSQSVSEYEDLLRFADSKQIAIWVNCKTRAHSSHQHVKKHINEGDSIILSVVGGNHGLATNGVHVADVFAYYADAARIEHISSNIDDVLYPSKRAGGLFDLSGTLVGCTSKGSRLFVSFSGRHYGPTCFTIVSERYRAIIDDMNKVLFESEKSKKWKWVQVPFDANMLVSNMTRQFASDIITKQSCDLPTLQQCYAAHEFILNALLPKFKETLDVDGSCPVT